MTRSSEDERNPGIDRHRAVVIERALAHRCVEAETDPRSDRESSARSESESSKVATRVSTDEAVFGRELPVPRPQVDPPLEKGQPVERAEPTVTKLEPLPGRI